MAASARQQRCTWRKAPTIELLPEPRVHHRVDGRLHVGLGFDDARLLQREAGGEDGFLGLLDLACAVRQVRALDLLGDDILGQLRLDRKSVV